MQSSSASSKMDGIAAIRGYIDRLVTGDNRCPGMKVLLLDSNTTQIISSVYSQTEILSKEIYLVSRLDDGNSNPNIQEVLPPPTSSSGFKQQQQYHNESFHRKNQSSNTSHLKAICFLRPTDINAGLIVRELSRPRFAEYHLFFTGITPSSILRLLADNDEMELICQIQEFYGDFLPINDDLFSLNCRHTLAMTQSINNHSNQNKSPSPFVRDHTPIFTRNKEGLESILLALKRQPAFIRYDRRSETAKQLANDINESITSDEIFHFRQIKQVPLLLMILDRSSDPVTPLLSQWTYQAMIHELLGLNNNRLDLANAPGISKELQQVVLNAEQDDFFKENRHKNFGELGEAVKQLLDEYQTKTSTAKNKQLNSIEDMQQFMEQFPEIKAQSHTVSKHVAIMGELARLVDVCALLDVSQFEQELACADDHSMHVRELKEKLASSNVKIPDKLRLGLLYAIRYENSGNISNIKQLMIKGGVSSDMVDLVDVILHYGGTRGKGSQSNGGNLLGNQNVLSKMTKSILTSVQGVANVYSQHVPLLMDIIQSTVRGKLKESNFPYVRGTGQVAFANKTNSSSNVNSNNSRPMEIIIFMVGGVTYEEATKVNEFNENNPTGVKVVLAGSTIHNSTSFLEELKEL